MRAEEADVDTVTSHDETDANLKTIELTGPSGEKLLRKARLRMGHLPEQRESDSQALESAPSATTSSEKKVSSSQKAEPLTKAKPPPTPSSSVRHRSAHRAVDRPA